MTVKDRSDLNKRKEIQMKIVFKIIVVIGAIIAGFYTLVFATAWL